MQPEASYIGRTIDGRYVVESVLGRGGMGVVLRVRHKYTGQHAALKLLHPHLRMQGDLAQRFLAEARAPAAIGHPGIVTVVDAGFSPEGELYLVMELLRGMTLAAAMKEQPLPFAAIRRIGLEILAALGAAHAAGFIHRDLKPENVFLADPTGTVKLLDFGIAKVLDERLGARGETQTGMVMGTVAYMSPEQLRDSSNVDLRTDLWAVGVMIYEQATGRLPYQADTLGNLLVAMMSQAPRPLAEALAQVPPALELFLRRALAVDVHARFSSAAEMAAVLGSMHVVGLARRAAGARPVAAPAAVAPAPVPVPVAPVPPAPRLPPPASIPPPVAAAPSVAPAPLAAPPSAMSLATPAASVPPAAEPARRVRTPLVVAAAALLVAVGLAVALVIVLSGKKDAPAAVAAAAPAAAPDAAAAPAPAPAPAPSPTPDAAPVPPGPPGPTPPPVPPPGPAPKPAKAPTRRELCKAACTTSQKKCGIRYVGPCVETCLAYSDEAFECLAEAEDDCNAIGACGFEALCGEPPSGRASCQATAACVIGCGDDETCVCRCATAMNPARTNLFMAFASCAISRCAGDCEVSPTMCLSCVKASCAASAAACMAQ